ncbi:YadA-like family protein [Escherichia fergusonii]|uniref:YadA-like family protein n=1 Tax=Escherichia fergusonii TaxID=564 RepID=UPI0015E5907D|nr:YadA-like family protein [Escherichia fergusonii]QLM91496.1 YadA-like family protein [Escherichia fergusonii]QLN38361.1 YadA-like family protein [Escherichia fergusonii]QMH68961.1 YadA-like family protein [Escherichia fergusonii]QML48101.1 YadA-like family protein [Escherichia fergusonii]QMS03928.1 YadA-like family protein [Escherichia fergusonii]
MNKIFKVIWNPATGSYSVASETAKSRGKKSGRRKLLASALIATSGILASFGALANAGNDTGTSTNTGSTSGWIAIGTDAIANDFTGPDGASTALGYKTQALGQWGTAIGALSESSGAASTALGVNATASGNRTTAIGASANSSGEYSIAMGVASKTFGKNSSAFGYLSTTGPEAEGSLALGYKSNAGGQYSVAMGAAAIANGKDAIAAGRDSAADGTDSLALGRKSHTVGVGSIAMGAGSTTQGDNTIALGVNSFALGNQSLSLGTATQAKGVNSTALGNASLALGDSSLAIGDSSEASDANTIALGKNSNASKVNSIALGSNSDASGDNAVSLGESSFAGGTNSLALGSQSSANGNNSVALGAGSVADIDNTVSVGNSTTQRQITNMAAGEISTTSTDAINGSQLYTISKSVADRLGSGASVNANGTVNAPSYKMKSGTYNNVGEALSGIDNDTLHWDKSEGAFSASYIVKNADGTIKSTVAQNKIINVADGTISATSTDAVNGSQLKTTNDTVAANTTNIATNTTNITNLTDAVDSLGDDSLLWSDAEKAFSAAHGTEATSKITNVTAGDLTAGSTDAVNGSQLKTTNDTVAANTTNIATNTTNITNLTDAVDSLGDDSLLWSDAAKAFSAAHGTEATSKITNVTAGDLTAGSTDAVNGSQLKTTNDTVAANTTNIATNTTNITNLTDAVDSLGDDSLLWSDAAKAFSAAHGTEATSKITNVTAGDLTAGSTDAVNGSQLKTTNDTVAANTTNIATNTTNITNLTDAIDSLGDDSLLWNDTVGAFSAAHGTLKTASKITNVANGDILANSSDAINGSQLYSLADSFTTYLGGGADISDTGVLTGPTYTIGSTKYYNVGDALNAINSSFSTSLGDALLWDSTAKKFSAMHDGKASVITNVSDGAISENSSDAVNGSQLYDTSKYIADALGGDAEVNADGTITAPTYTIANADYDNVGEALEAIDTTLDDALLWDATANGGKGAFSAGRGVDNTASKITNVANGAISAASSDAINGSQLYTTNKYIADALGGDAEVNADGTITAPTYTIANAEYNNIGDALDALDDNALLWDATANDGKGAYSASHDGKASIITNIADGYIGEGSTDAVNGSQLNAANLLIEQNSQIINQLAGNTNTDYIENNGAGINYVRTNDTGLTFTDASAAGIGSTAVGYNSVAKGDSSVAIGQGSYSDVDTGIALGSSSVSKREIVKGSRDTSVSEEGVVIGYDTTDGELLGALSIGDDGKYRQIINVADGSEAHDAVTVRQLQNAIGAVATTPTKYFHANSTEEDSLAVGTDSLAMGAKTIVNGDKGIGIGYGAYVEANALNGIAIGSNAQVIHVNSIAIGNGSTTTRGAQTNYTAYNMDAPQNSVGEFSVGNEDGQRQITNVAAGSADTDAVNVGQLKVTDERVAQNTQSITNLNTQVTNLDTRVTNIENGIGDIVTTGSTKYFKTNTDGVDANAQGKDSVAIGSGSIAAADNSVALGTGSVATEENTISVGSSTNQRRITNVAAGKNDTDAVNVAQLKSSEAGGVRYDTKADGSVDYSNITLGGSSGGTTRISNVSAGVNNNDAVNYAQLKQSVQENKQYTDQRMAQMDHKLSKTESKLSGGIASAMAMTGLPQAYEPGANMASIGGGTYNGESAVALGVSMVSDNGRWVYKLQGSTNSQGDYSAAIGAGIQW